MNNYYDDVFLKHIVMDILMAKSLPILTRVK